MSIQQLASPVRTLENGHFTRAQALSLSLHIAIVALLLAPMVTRNSTPRIIGDVFHGTIAAPIDWISERRAEAERAKREGGGGDRTLTEPTAGRLPPRNWLQLTPPRPVTPKESRLQLQPTLIGDPSVQPPDSSLLLWGDPRRTQVTFDAGPGARGGVGKGCCRSIGDGKNGDGTDEEGNGAPYAGTRGHNQPVCAYCPNPPFTEEAIRVRWQGTVVLRALVTADGRATSISIVRGAGMGLDENAVAKVKTWRLTPARGPDGQPAAVWTLIEVIFRQH